MNQQDLKIVRQIKDQVCKLPDLDVPPKNAIIIIETDGCMDGWGGICKWKLSKGETRMKERICAYASGRFNPIKGAIDAEIQAVILSLEKFKIYYLDKSELIIRTDSKAIVRFYEKCSEHKPSRVRWMTLTDYISGCGVKVSFEHIDGKENLLADELSRLVQALVMEKFEHSSLKPLLKAVSEVTERTKDLQAEKRLAACISKILPKGFPVYFMAPPIALQCACGKDAAYLISHTSRNPGRRFYKCADNRCHVWYWADLIEDYVQQRLMANNVNNINNEPWFHEDEDPIAEPEVLNDEDWVNSEVDDPPEDSGLFHQQYD